MKQRIFSLALVAACALMACAQRIAVLSDLHVTPGNACDSALTLVINEINSQQLDAVIVNGDLTNEGADAELRHMKAMLSRLKHPTIVIPGNHENNWSQSATKTFRDLWGDDKAALRVGSLLIAGVNCGPYMKMGDGHIKDEDLHWLEKTLADSLAPGMRLLSICHMPMRVEDLDNYKREAAILSRYPTVAQINGHYHSWQRYDVGTLPCVMTRALDMRDGTFGYAIVDIGSEWIHVYDKSLGKRPAHKFTFAARTAHKPVEPEPLPPVASPYGWEIERVWADSASIFTRVGVSSGAAFAGSSTGAAKRVEGGEQMWSIDLANSLFSRPVALPGGLVAFPHARGIVLADAATGRIAKRIESATPYVADGVVTPDGRAWLQGGFKRMECRSAADGELLWVCDSIDNYCQGAPAVDGDDVVFGAWDTCLRCLSLADGRLKWEWTNGKPNNLFSPGNVVPAICGDKVIIVAPDRYMTALDRATGRQLWRDNSYRYRESMGASPDGKAVYAKTMDGELVAVDATAPQWKTLWVTDMGIGYDHAPCVVAQTGTTVLAGSRHGVVTALDAATGRLLWQRQLGTSEVNGIEIAPDGSAWLSLIEGTVWRLAPKQNPAHKR